LRYIHTSLRIKEEVWQIFSLNFFWGYGRPTIQTYIDYYFIFQSANPIKEVRLLFNQINSLLQQNKQQGKFF